MDALPRDVLLLVFVYCPTKKAFGSLRTTCKELKESSASKELLLTKRKLDWRDKIVRNQAMLRGRDHVDACWFSADGARIQTVTRPLFNFEASIETVSTWDAETGARLNTLERPWTRCTGVTSPDETRWLRFGRLPKLYDFEGGTLLKTLAGRISGLRTSQLRVFSPDSARVVTLGCECAQIFSAEDGQLLMTLVGHRHIVDCVEFSPDGARVVTASQDRTARVWDAATGATLMTLRGHPEILYCCAFSPSGAHVVTGSYDGTARVWDVRASQR
jgi:WD40 repeat protein